MEKKSNFQRRYNTSTRSSNKDIIQKEEKEQVKQDRSSHFWLKIQLY